MLPDRVSNPGPLTYESGVLPIALRGPALTLVEKIMLINECSWCCLLDKVMSNVSISHLTNQGPVVQN